MTEIVGTSEVRARKIKLALVAAVVLALIVGFTVWATNVGTKDSDAADACQKRVSEMVGDYESFEVEAVREHQESSNPNYSNEWSVSGAVTSDHVTGETRAIPYVCTLHMDSSGNELDGKVALAL